MVSQCRKNAELKQGVKKRMPTAKNMFFMPALLQQQQHP
jgi:hypothetical protein